MKLQNKIGALVLSCSLSITATAGTCPPFNDLLVIAKMAAIELALKQVFTSLITSLSGGILSFDKQDLSAIKVVTSQVATAAKAQINSAATLKQGEMAAIGHLEKAKQQLKIYQDFSPLTGQGVDPCGQMTAQSRVTTAGYQAQLLAGDTMSRVEAAPGRYGSAEDYTNRMLKTRQSLFATRDEEVLGFGKAATEEVVTTTGSKFPLAGADTNAGVLFADSADPRITVAKAAFLNHMAGEPDQAITLDSANLASGKEYLANKGRKDAGLSAALYSMSMVSAENTPNAQGKSKAQAIRDMVGLYYGASASSRWMGWTSQSSRGVMVDQMKIDAAQLAIKAEQYKSGQRLEVMLGTMLLNDVQQQYAPALASAAQSLDSQRSRPGVR